MTAGLVLGIETATTQVGVALGGPDGVVGSLYVRRGRRHAEVLTPAIDSLTRLCDVSLDDLERIAVDVGPGLFTGIRVGVATAKALASALGLPLVGCSSLDLLAHPHAGFAGTVAAVVDARRGEVFWALYRDGTSVSAARVTPPGELADAVAGGGGSVLAVGDGARRYAPDLEGAGAVLGAPASDHPSPAVLVELGGRATAEVSSAIDLQPVYLRAPDVRIGWEERDRAVRA